MGVWRYGTRALRRISAAIAPTLPRFPLILATRNGIAGEKRTSECEVTRVTALPHSHTPTLPHSPTPLLARTFVLGLTILCGAAGRPGTAQAPAPAHTPEDAIVLIRTVNSLRTARGSGFLIGDGSWAVTASHVVSVDLGKGKRLADRTALVYSPWTGRPYEAKVAAIDGVADIALLRLPQAGLPALPVEGLQVKEAVAAKEALENRPLRLFGFPLTYGEATVASLARPQHNDSQLFEITRRGETSLAALRACPDVQPGWSGGPIVSLDKGNVVAVFHSLYRPSPDKEGYPAGSVTGYLGNLLKQAGVPDPAVFAKVPAPALPRDPKGAERMAHEMRSMSWSAAGDWKRAAEEQREILKLFPEDGPARTELGRLLLAGKEYEESLKLLEGAVQRMPQSVFAALYAARAYHLNYDARAALRILEASLKNTPEEIEPYLVLAEIHESSQKGAEAEAILRSALTRSPEHPIVLLRLGQLLLRQPGGTKAEIEKRESEGLALLKQASQLAGSDPSLSDVLLGYARALETNRKFREAESVYRSLLRLDPESPLGYYYLAYLFLRLNRVEEAQLQLNAGIRLPNLPDATVEAFRALQVQINGRAGSSQ